MNKQSSTTTKHWQRNISIRLILKPDYSINMWENMKDTKSQMLTNAKKRKGQQLLNLRDKSKKELLQIENDLVQFLFLTTRKQRQFENLLQKKNFSYIAKSLVQIRIESLKKLQQEKRFTGERLNDDILSQLLSMQLVSMKTMCDLNSLEAMKQCLTETREL